MRHDFLGPALDCSGALERLPLFVGEDLEPGAHAAVLQHLQLCGACRGEEARARSARERFRGVLDESLRSSSRAGLWPELRARLVEEGLLAGADEASATEVARPRAPRTAALPLSSARPDQSLAPVESARRSPASPARGWSRLLAPLAAAAAVVLTVLATDPFRPSPGDARGGTAPAVTPVVPVASLGVASETTGGLRRVAAEERSLSQDAEPLLLRDGLAGPRPARQSGPTLVSYR